MKVVFGLRFILVVGYLMLPVSDAIAREPALDAQSFDGNFLGMHFYADRLGIVLDVSESMGKELPALRAALKKELPRAPMLQVDGCALEEPEPRAETRIARGMSPDTVTAVKALGEHAGVDAVLWICDMGDPPNRYGVEAMAEVLAARGIRLYLISVASKPGPNVRKMVDGSDGGWLMAVPES
ncbi:MAG: hypothetical protein AAGD22_06955 [Verrucomicrobiota bacterium]